MSSSSTTACSRSPSPTTPEASDTLDPAVTQEVVDAWCHSLSPDPFAGSDSQYEAVEKDGTAASLDLDDLIQDDAYEDTTPSRADMSPSFFAQHPQSFPYALTLDAAPNYRHRPSSSSAKPIPPPPSQARREPPLASLQSVVHPPKETCSNLPIMFPSLPQGGTKSRVETQVRLTVDLAHASSSSNEPLKYDRVGSWKWLRLPKGTSTKRRTRKEGKIDATPEDALLLTTEVTCASPPHTKVTCCTSCQAREAKRIERKLAARIRPTRSDDEYQDDAAIIPGRGKHEDTSKLIQFNCPEVLDFSDGTVILPLRITCYCRHHREKTGFNVHFTFYDHTGRVVGSGVTRPIMITDDHKSTGVNKSQSQSQANGSTDVTPDVDWASRTIGECPEGSGHILTKRKTRAEVSGDRTKKRTKPYDGRRTGKLPRKGSTSSLNSPLGSGVPSAFTTTRSSTPALSHGASSPTAVSSTVPTTPELSDHAAAEVVASILSQATFDAPVVGGCAEQRVEGSMFEDIVMPDAPQPLNTAELSLGFLSPEMPPPIPMALQSPQLAMPSSPQSQISAQPTAPLALDLQQQMQFLFNPNPPPLGLPKIHRLIPASGPTYGGIEITVLGANFHQNMQLNCVFGDARSTSTQRWSDNTLVCLLPPSPTPGVVAVWFDGVQKENDGSPPSLFAYTDETDRALMELALQVVGLKMTGKIEDARDVAMRIVNTTGPENMNAMSPHGGMQLATSPTVAADIRHLLFARAGDTGDFEKLILDFLAVLDTPMQVPTWPHASVISHTTASGQTLLHLATFLGFATLVEFLLEHKIDIDARDKNGYTALHFAALKESAACARLLVEAGAAPDIVNALGKTAVETAPVGFFEDLFIGNPDRRRMSDDDRWCSNRNEEEAAWGDVEEGESSEEETSPPASPHALLRRSDRKLAQWKNKHALTPAAAHHAASESSADEKPPLPPSKPADLKLSKEAEASAVDEKQVASLMEMFQRTFAQLQYPQGMIPNLPLHLPGMPAWGALSQMPAVFPVYVPIPALMTLFGERRDAAGEPGVDVGEVESEKVARGQQWLGIPTAQEWRAMLERWVVTARTNEEAPPAYTPRETEEQEKEKEKEQVKEQEKEVKATGAEHHHVGPAVAARRVVVHETVAVPEEEIKNYGYRPVKKPSRKVQKKHDRMLILFWIPILFIGLIWAFLHSMRVGFHAIRTVLTLKAGLRV